MWIAPYVEKSELITVFFLHLARNNILQLFMYHSTIQLFCIHSRFIQGGKELYEFERANSPSPHVRTIQRYIKKQAENFLEGRLMVAELKKYLITNGYPLLVCWSEDATRITGGIEYKVSSDQLTGLVAPLNASNGMPVTSAFGCSTPRQVLNHLQNFPVGRNVQLTMIQPLMVGASPFCVNYYCTDNRFKSEDVTKKWNFTQEIFEEVGIKIVCRATDGDSRFIRSMIDRMTLPNISDNPFGDWFVALPTEDAICVQDPTHLANKFRTRLMNTSKQLMLGKAGNDLIRMEHFQSQVKQ